MGEAVVFVEAEVSSQGVLVLGGTKADPADFAATFVVESTKTWCSGTLVGQNVFLTAAHCLERSRSVTIKSQGGSFSGDCVVADGYIAGDPTADWALCELDGSPAVEFEVVNIDPGLLVPNQELMLVGFGCHFPGGPKGTLRYGYAPITRVPSPTDHFVVTRGLVATCFGDSGNAAFLPLEPTGLSRRVQVAVNSLSNIQDLSAMSSTSAPPAVSFMRTWSVDRGLEICGLSSGASGCRPN